jgi:glycosyltransferase involved in cell wall biosynthesis
MNSADISIIICTYNRAERLRAVLEDVRELALPAGASYEVIVVDNNSRDDTRGVVEAAAQRSSAAVRYVFEGRQGKSFALNRGVSLATGEVIAFTDDDVAVDRAWLAEALRAFASHDCLGVGGRIIPAWGQNKPWWYEEDGPYRLMAAIVRLELGEQVHAMQTPPFGANMAFQRRAFDKYGLFREDLGPNAENEIRGEDTEFCRRLMASGEMVLYVPTMVVRHPVEKERATKAYFRKWYFAYGRASVRMSGIPDGAVQYFMVPRYLFRGMLTLGMKWLFCGEPKRRFFYELQLCQVAGEVAESRAIVKRQADTTH